MISRVLPVVFIIIAIAIVLTYVQPTYAGAIAEVRDRIKSYDSALKAADDFKEQEAKLKKEGRLGVMAGDEICNVSTFCWTIEDAERFRKKCAEMKDHDDESLGFYACVLIVATGADDVKRFRFFDPDTKCIIQVRGGPSNVDNDLIGKCAKTAYALIGPDQIKPGAPAATAPAEGSAAGSGSAD